jgi:DNA-binding NarL/FixJ family response regulator
VPNPQCFPSNACGKGQNSASSQQATILIADDFANWRARVRRILSGRPEWQIVGEGCDGVEAVLKAAELRPDIVLLDIGMPALNGIQAAEKIRQTTPGSKIVFLHRTTIPS